MTNINLVVVFVGPCALLYIFFIFTTGFSGSISGQTISTTNIYESAISESSSVLELNTTLIGKTPSIITPWNTGNDMEN